MPKKKRPGKRADYPGEEIIKYSISGGDLTVELEDGATGKLVAVVNPGDAVYFRYVPDVPDPVEPDPEPEPPEPEEEPDE